MLFSHRGTFFISKKCQFNVHTLLSPNQCMFSSVEVPKTFLQTKESNFSRSHVCENHVGSLGLDPKDFKFIKSGKKDHCLIGDKKLNFKTLGRRLW
jgi:hypothetical protein